MTVAQLSDLIRCGVPGIKRVPFGMHATATRDMISPEGVAAQFGINSKFESPLSKIECSSTAPSSTGRSVTERPIGLPHDRPAVE
jgi:hypothetical protein